MPLLFCRTFQHNLKIVLNYKLKPMYQMSHNYSIDQLVAPYFSQRTFSGIAAEKYLDGQLPAIPIYSPWLYSNKIKDNYHSVFSADLFLKPGTSGKFIGATEEIINYVTEAFSTIFNRSLPENINISVLDHHEFKKLAPHPSTVGLSVNRGQFGLPSDIFVLNDSLGRVLLTLGHELGHVLTPTLRNHHDEEAKAYAFSILWMEKIRENNIAGLSNSIITELPALNGLHDVAFGFVRKLLKAGKNALEVYTDLIKGLISYLDGYS